LPVNFIVKGLIIGITFFVTVIELVDAEDGHLVPALSDLTENGKLIYVVSQSEQLAPQQAVTTMFLEQQKRPFLPAFFAGSAASTDGTLIGGTSALLEQVKAFSKRLHTDRRDVCGFRQFIVLMRIMLLRITRARLALTIQLFHHLLCGLFFGLIFFQLGNQGARMFDHLKFCIGAVLMIVYTQVMVPILSCKCFGFLFPTRILNLKIILQIPLR